MKKRKQKRSSFPLYSYTLSDVIVYQNNLKDTIRNAFHLHLKSK